MEAIYQDIVKRNPGEAEFHQAVREVLECLGPGANIAGLIMVARAMTAQGIV